MTWLCGAVLATSLLPAAEVGAFGDRVVIHESALAWQANLSVHAVRLELAEISAQGNSGDLYVNRDAGHSQLKLADFPGLTEIVFDDGLRRRSLHLDAPNMLFPYPVFGNASRAILGGEFWRSIPRALMTTQARQLKAVAEMYRSNQLWFFPAHQDAPPSGTLGDVFPSMTPYWLVTAGSSWSDQPYLRAALEASRTLPRETKAAAVKRGMLAPTIFTLLRKSLKGVADEEAYLTPAAHPTAFSAGALDLPRLKRLAGGLRPEELPPVVAVTGVGSLKVADEPALPELTYASYGAWALFLRSADTNRAFTVRATGAQELVFRIVHDPACAAAVTPLGPRGARIAIDRTRLNGVSRVDLAVFGRNPGTGWGAPAYVSFAARGENDEYADPFFDHVKGSRP